MLGSLLCNILINNQFLLVLNSDICNFADISINQIINGLECDIDILQTWVQNNGMLLNETKFQFLIIESSRCKRVEAASLKVFNEIIYEKRW